MNVLSLFDGISCGQVALKRAGIKVRNYFASEIDKHAIKVTQHNFPNTIQLGDVIKINSNSLPEIDLLIGGSPCQGFSFMGKQLNFDDPRSKLFFEYVRLLKEVKPKYFLLENVKMKKEYINVISDYLDIEPIEINSSLVSAQNRKRLYWTNIFIEFLENKNYILKDILEDNVDINCYLTKEASNKLNLNYNWKVNSIISHKGGKHQEDTLHRYDGKMGCLVASAGKCKTKTYLSDGKVRHLTPIEFERLQTLPDNYTENISDNQRYKTLGNGWTIDVIAHIFKGIRTTKAMTWKIKRIKKQSIKRIKK